MRPQHTFCVWIFLSAASVAAAGSQSLTEIAKKEAERRRLLDQQGIEARKIEQENVPGLASKGSVSLSSLPGSGPPARLPAQTGRKPSLEQYRTGLRTFDAEIVRSEERLGALRKRLDLEKDAPIRLGRGVRPGAAGNSKAKLQSQIQDLEIKLKRLRTDRLKLYDTARKAGFLPGELKD
jgi:hypothetical protein